MRKIPVMISGLPDGNMANIILKQLIMSGKYDILPLGLTGPEHPTKKYTVQDREFFLVNPSDLGSFPHRQTSEDMITIDFTHPNAVNGNAEFYCTYGMPFVMGTTGGDRAKLEETVRRSGISAVIATNMSPAIVAQQNFLARYAEKNPNALLGCELLPVESHQPTKKDPSGTALSLIRENPQGVLHKLGFRCPIERVDLDKIRAPDTQRELGIPNEYLNGHGWHTYVIESPPNSEALENFVRAYEKFLTSDEALNDFLREFTGKHVAPFGGTQFFRVSKDGTQILGGELQGNKLGIIHNINGRAPYGQGAEKAIDYLFPVQDVRGKVISMLDILYSKRD